MPRQQLLVSLLTLSHGWNFGLENERPELIRILWQEQHPKAKEQTSLDFKTQEGIRETLRLFADDPEEAIVLSVQTGKRIPS